MLLCEFPIASSLAKHREREEARLWEGIEGIITAQSLLRPFPLKSFAYKQECIHKGI
jgi:hypothetical protein